MKPETCPAGHGAHAGMGIWMYLDTGRFSQYHSHTQTQTNYTHTVGFSKASIFREITRHDSQSVIFYDTVSSAILNNDVNFGGAGVERVLEKAADDAVERSDGRGGPDLANDVLWQRPDGHGT